MFEKEESAEAGGASRPVEVFSGGGGEVMTRGVAVRASRPDGRQTNPCAKYVVLQPARSEREREDALHCYSTCRQGLTEQRPT